MPRVQGLDTTQRRRHSVGPTPSSSTTRGGIFSLSTPFTNFAGRAPPLSTGMSIGNNNHSGHPSSSEMMTKEEDDLSFREETQQSSSLEEEVPGTQNPNFPSNNNNMMAPLSRMALPPPSTAAHKERGGGGDNNNLHATNNNNTLNAQNYQQMQHQFAMTVYQQQQQQQGQGQGQVNNVGLPPVVHQHHHHSSVDNHSRGNNIDGSSTSHSSGGGIATKITPREKSCPSNNERVDLKQSSSSTRSNSSASSNNIRGGASHPTFSSSSNTVTANSNLGGVSYQGDERMTPINRQSSSSSRGMRGALGEDATTTTSSSSTTAAAAMTSASSSSSAAAGAPSSSVESTTTKQVRSNNTTTASSTTGGQSSNTALDSVIQKNPTAATTATIASTIAMSNDHDKEVAIATNSNQSNVTNDNEKNKLEFKDGMDDDDDDSESNSASDDDDEEQSVDLLNDNSNNDVLPTRINNNNTSHPNNNNNTAFSQSPISPATQTLDRLSMIGSQDGGAELCVQLSVNAVDTPTRKEEEDNVARKKSTEEEKGNATANVSTAKGTSTTTAAVVSTRKDDGRRNDGGQQRKKGSSNTTTITLTKQQCIRNLKAYFMSTQNSAVYAQNKLNSNNNSGGMELPLVTFCHNCNNKNKNKNNTLSQVPHHSLCPKHEDFFVSGSYEILNLIVDGNILGCTACMHHFRNGRPNKQLVHLENCKRYKKVKGKGKKGQTSSVARSSGSAGGMGLSQLSMNTGAEEGAADTAGAARGDQTQKKGSSSSDGRQDSPELSDYEKLRLRNIQRNEARLAALGLLAPSNKKAAASTTKSNKEGFLSRSDPNNGEPKKVKSKKKKKKQPEVQKRTQPKRLKQKIGDEDPSPSRSAPASTNKENSGISNQKQRHTSDVRKDNVANIAKGKAIESRSSLVEAAKSGCRKCTLEWQTDTKDPTKHHDSCCPRANSSRLVNTQQQQQLNRIGPKKTSRTPQPQNSSPIAQKKKASQVTPRLLPSTQEARHTSAPPTMTMADTSIDIEQSEQSMVSDVDSNLFHYALQKGFSAAFLRGKTEEELLALLSGNRVSSQQSAQTILPPFIRDFIAEADRNDEIPAPRGTKWLSCPNPWGKIGHEEGDFVVISPFQSESTADMVSVFHQCPNGNIPKRFVANPLEEGSPYHDTHRSPARKGYSVLRLTRDRMGLRPWGFTVRLHEFGGACLVDSIEPLSPAEAAEDISGWTSKGTPAGLQLHDMIICVNGKSVGSMTEAELQLDLELCGSEMMLVVARFDIEGNTNQDMTLADLAMEWNDIGAGAPPRKKTVSFENEESSENSRNLNTQSKSLAAMNESICDRSESYSRNHEDDDSANEVENESDDDGLDESEDAPSSNLFQSSSEELESKSDEALMKQLVDTVESGYWKQGKDSQLAKLVMKRAFRAAAKDERFQRLSCNSGGVTKDQVLEWMRRSATFQHYERTVMVKWSESTFQIFSGTALKDAGYTKICGGTFARYALPDDILSRELQLQGVLSQNYQSDEEAEATSDEDGADGSEVWVPRFTQELESKSDEELMQQLTDTIESGNWNKVKDAQLAKLVAKRGFIAAANDERVQRLSCNSGGAITKEQVLEWMSRSATFQQYEQTMRAKWSEGTFQQNTSAALKDAGYTKTHCLGKRWSLPEGILARGENVSSQNYQSDEERENDEDGAGGLEDGSSFDWVPRFTQELESKSDVELMQQLLNTVESGKWNKAKDPQLAKLLAKRGFIAAAKDERFQRFSCNSGGVTKDHVLEWMSRSSTFQQYEQTMRAKWSEASFQLNTSAALKGAGYVKIRGGGSCALARYALPEDILPRESQTETVLSQNYQSDDEVAFDREDSEDRKQWTRKVDTFESEFESTSDEELMQQLTDTIESDNWKSNGPPLAKLVMKRAFRAAAKDERFQRMSCNSGGVTKDQTIEWLSQSSTFQQYERIVRAKWSEKSFINYSGEALKDSGYVLTRSFGGAVKYLLPEDILPRELQCKNVQRGHASKQNANAGKRKRKSDTFAKRKKQFNLYSDDSSQSSLEEESENEDDDDNPWLGCVCGRTHPPPIQVFWIQCGTCDAWHNVAEDCVGFSEEAADTIDEWHCWSCNPPCAGLNL